MPLNIDPAKATLPDIAGAVRDISVQIEDGDRKVSADLKALNDKAISLDKWIAEVEKAVNKARTGGFGRFMETDALRSAIPDRHRKCIDLHVRFGNKPEDAILRTALESWLKNSLLLQNPMVAAKIGAQLIEELDLLEKSFGFEPLTKAALNEGTVGQGGYLVPTPLEAEVLRIAQDAGIMRGLCRVVPMTVVTHNFPNLSTNVSVTAIDEGATITESEPTFGRAALTAKKIAVRSLASMELVQDSAIGILNFVITLMSEQYGLFEDKQILEGDGTGSNFTGVVAACGVNEIYAAGASAGNGSLFTPAQALAQKWKARKRATRRGAAWVAAPEILQQIEGFRADAVSANDKAGAPFYSPLWATVGAVVGNGAMGAEGILHGFPIFSHADILVNRTVGSASNCSNMYFGPWNNAVIIGDLLGLQFGVSEHSQWATGQLDLRMIKRTGILVALPAALTKQTGLKIA